MQYVTGPDSRKWRVVEKANPCKFCGSKPIAARCSVGWNIECPNEKSHAPMGQFEQWLKKCIYEWNCFNPE